MNISDLPPELVAAEARNAAASRAVNEAPVSDGVVGNVEWHLRWTELFAAFEDFQRHLGAEVIRRAGGHGRDREVYSRIGSDIRHRLAVARRTETHALMLGLTSDRQLLFVPGGDQQLRLPITAIRDSETTIDAAMRALEEQTGARMRGGRSPGQVCPTLTDPDRPTVHVMVADWIDTEPFYCEPGIHDSTVLVPVEDVPDRIVAGQIRDQITIDAYRLAVATGILRHR